MIHALGAASMSANYLAAALIAALAERGAIDPARVFQLVEVLATGFDTQLTAAGPTGPMTAKMLRALRPIYENLVTIPPGAGRA